MPTHAEIMIGGYSNTDRNDVQMKSSTRRRVSRFVSESLLPTRLSRRVAILLICTGTLLFLRNHMKSSNLNLPSYRLRVVVWSASGCDGRGCEDVFGGSRIWSTNLGAGLRLLGHEVRFTNKEPNSSSDVIMAHSNVILTQRDLIERISKLAHLLVLAKPNGVPTDIMNSFDLIPFGSLLHMQHECSRGLHHNRTYFARHMEVPLKFWQVSSQSPDISMYQFIPKHRPHHDKFSISRKAKICYHGSVEHLLEEGISDMTEAIQRLQEEFAVEFVALTGDKERRSTIPASVSKLLSWSGTDFLFSFAASCDIGVIPNYAKGPHLIDEPPYPLLQLTFKSSVNAGRAYVFAQTGLPFVGHPEVELAELVGTAGIDPAIVFASGVLDWYNKLRFLLLNPMIREELSEKLRADAHEILTIQKEAKVLEAHILNRMPKEIL
jgi:hypothetical protein